MKYGCSRIAVAHNRDDQTETVLLNLCRGSGVAGLTGIPPVRGKVIRPLLFSAREEIEEYLRELGQTYCTDSTNGEDAYTRNRIRHQVVPLLTGSVNRKTAEHITEMAVQLRQVEEYLSEQTEEQMKNVLQESGSCLWREEDFRNCPPVLAGRVVLRLAESLTGSRRDFTAKAVRTVTELFGKEVSKEADLPCGIRAVRIYEGVRLERARRTGRPELFDACETVPEYPLVLPPEGKCQIEVAESGTIFQFELLDFCENGVPECVCDREITFSSGKIVKIPESSCVKWFDYDKMLNTVIIRTRRPGDVICVHPDGKKKKLKDHWIDRKVPKEERDQIWFLAEGSNVIWIPDGRTGENYRIDENTVQILAVQIIG